MLEDNPTEWIAKELQVMSDKYDGIRAFIMEQNVAAEQLPSSYSKMPIALYSRE